MKLKLWQRENKPLKWDDIDTYSENYACESRAVAVTFHDGRSDEVNLFEQAAAYLKKNRSGRLVSVNLSGGEFGSSLNLYFYDREAESKVLHKWPHYEPHRFKPWYIRYKLKLGVRKWWWSMEYDILNKLGLQKKRPDRGARRGGRN
jgi:hypothetical protein